MSDTGVLRPPKICLEEVLAQGRMTPARAQHLARQVARELCIAHQFGVSHGALTPANIVLTGSGKQERAMLKGFAEQSIGSFDSDMYAFGEVLEQMLPGHRLAADCRSLSSSQRPPSFEFALEELEDFSACRTWIGSFLIMTAIGALFFAK